MCFIRVDVVRLPVLCGVTQALLARLLKHLFRRCWVIIGSARVSKQLGVVHVLVFNQVVRILRRDNIVAWLNCLSALLAVLGTETTKVGETILTARLLHGCILVVVALERSLSWLENGVRLVAIGQS